MRIAGANGPRTVLIFGGGYDTRQDGTDTDGTSPDGGDIYNNSSNGDSMGNAIFIVDADTGERLWWASSSSDGNGDAPDAVVSSMNTAIPAPITPLDTNEDGLIRPAVRCGSSGTGVSCRFGSHQKRHHR